MAKHELSIAEIRKEGLEALQDRLGIAGMSRFLRIYGLGGGNYTEERREWLDDETVDGVAARIEQRRGP